MTVRVVRHDTPNPRSVITTASGTIVAQLEDWHHEAAGWADAVGEGAVVYRPRDYDGCPCPRCAKRWTQQQGDPRDRELPGDRLPGAELLSGPPHPADKR